MIKSKIQGSFSVKVFRGGKIIKELPRQGNLILQQKMAVLDRLGNYLVVGSGTTAPAYTNTTLETLVSVSAFSTWSESSPVLNTNTYEKEVVNTFTFPLGGVVGNLSELGVSSFSNGSSVDTRALFKDGAGDPTTITVTASDQLVVTYYVKKFYDMLPVTSSVLSGGNVIDYTIRPCISSNGNAGSDAAYPSSLYQTTASSNLFMTINDANRISVNPTTYVPTSIDTSGDLLPEGLASVVTTATGNEVTHTFTAPLNQGNFQWGAATFSDANSSSVAFLFFQIEFNGPNYITKNNTEIVTFKLKEIVEQVV